MPVVKSTAAFSLCVCVVVVRLWPYVRKRTHSFSSVGVQAPVSLRCDWITSSSLPLLFYAYLSYFFHSRFYSISLSHPISSGLYIFSYFSPPTPTSHAPSSRLFQTILLSQAMCMHKHLNGKYTPDRLQWLLKIKIISWQLLVFAFSYCLWCFHVMNNYIKVWWCQMSNCSTVNAFYLDKHIIIKSVCVEKYVIIL